MKRFGLCLLLVTVVLCGGLMQPGFAVADGGLIPDLTRFRLISDIGPYKVNNDNSGEGPRISFAVADGYLCDMTRSRLTCHDQHFPGSEENNNTVAIGGNYNKPGKDSALYPQVYVYKDSGLDPAVLAGLGLVKEGKPVPGYPVLPLGSAVVLPVGSSTALHKDMSYLACAYSVDHVFTCWGIEDESRSSRDPQPNYVVGGFTVSPTTGLAEF